MVETKSIDIDFDVHKRIESERKSFSETPNDVLRRVLGIEDKPSNSLPIVDPATPGRSWFGKGVELPHGTKLRMQYNGRTHVGEVDNGEWLVEGVRFNSPSAAAGGVARTRKGNVPSLDGWGYWHAKRPGEGSWILLSSLRR